MPYELRPSAIALLLPIQIFWAQYCVMPEHDRFFGGLYALLATLTRVFGKCSRTTN